VRDLGRCDDAGMHIKYPGGQRFGPSRRAHAWRRSPGALRSIITLDALIQYVSLIKVRAGTESIQKRPGCQARGTNGGSHQPDDLLVGQLVWTVVSFARYRIVGIPASSAKRAV
jgi:hypothetical protein